MKVKNRIHQRENRYHQRETDAIKVKIESIDI
jgi:hypothetical protein